jgi:hypothetical protein
MLAYQSSASRDDIENNNDNNHILPLVDVENIPANNNNANFDTNVNNGTGNNANANVIANGVGVVIPLEQRRLLRHARRNQRNQQNQQISSQTSPSNQDQSNQEYTTTSFSTSTSNNNNNNNNNNNLNHINNNDDVNYYAVDDDQNQILQKSPRTFFANNLQSQKNDQTNCRNCIYCKSHQRSHKKFNQNRNVGGNQSINKANCDIGNNHTNTSQSIIDADFYDEATVCVYKGHKHVPLSLKFSPFTEYSHEKISQEISEEISEESKMVVFSAGYDQEIHMWSFTFSSILQDLDDDDDDDDDDDNDDNCNDVIDDDDNYHDDNVLHEGTIDSFKYRRHHCASMNHHHHNCHHYEQQKQKQQQQKHSTRRFQAKPQFVSRCYATPLRVFQGHMSVITELNVDNQYILLSGSRDQSVLVWDIESGQVINRLVGQHMQDLKSIVYTIDGHIITSGYDKKICYWRFSPHERDGDAVVAAATAAAEMAAVDGSFASNENSECSIM